MTSSGALIRTECCTFYFVVHCVMVYGRAHTIVCKLCCSKAKFAVVESLKCFGTVRAFCEQNMRF